MLHKSIYKTLDQQLLIKSFWNRLSKINFITDNRERRNVIYKHSFFVSCRKLTSLSLKSIGSTINKDHATVLHALKIHEINYLYDNKYKDVYDQMFIQLESEVKKFNQDIYHMMQARALENYPDLHTDAVVQVYKNKLEEQEKHFELKEKAYKKEINLISKQNRLMSKRNEELNDECLRLKNLL